MMRLEELNTDENGWNFRRLIHWTGELVVPSDDQSSHFAKLVHALMSGTFKQTTGVLSRYAQLNEDDPPIGHCCMGVGCQLMLADNQIEYTAEPDTDHFYLYHNGHGSIIDTTWGRFEMEYFGIPTQQLTPGISLALANDGKHWSFAQIGAVLEVLWAVWYGSDNKYL